MPWVTVDPCSLDDIAGDASSAAQASGGRQLHGDGVDLPAGPLRTTAVVELTRSCGARWTGFRARSDRGPFSLTGSGAIALRLATVAHQPDMPR
jgi:hypothetical protein